MNKRMIMLMAAALALLSAGGQVIFSGVGEHHVIEVTPETTTGLNKIYVVYNTDGVSMSFNSMTGEPATWESFYYSNGHLVMEPVAGVRWNGMSTTVDKITPNRGYKIVEGTTPFYCWVVNYADYPLELNGMSFNNEEPCKLVSFNIDGHADPIYYYTLDGLPQVLDREIKLKYNTLVWINDSTDYHWEEQPVVELFAALDQGVEIAPPLCNTEFTMSGDRFLEEWGMGKTIPCDYYYTQAVECKAFAFQEKRSNDNEKGLGSGQENALGGSAPCRIVFKGYPTDAVVYRLWEMATDEEFQNVIMQFNQDEVDYTFEEYGTYYMRYTVANASGECQFQSEPFRITVSESYLECPNIFSPGTTPGDNDIWKVSYKSLIEFHCWIYNRWGNLLYEFTDPGGGWDGYYRGKLVDTGVYFYVVTALGSDGFKYKKRGTISILHFKKSNPDAPSNPGV